MSATEEPLRIAIDPGVNGAIVTRDRKGTLLEIIPMPRDHDDMAYLFSLFPPNSFCVIEQVGPRPTDGCRQLWTFSGNYHSLLQCMADFELSHTKVTPSEWQKGLGISPRDKTNETKGDWKNRLKAIAQTKFPKTKVTLSNADALLLSEYMHILVSHSKLIG